MWVQIQKDETLQDDKVLIKINNIALIDKELFTLLPGKNGTPINYTLAKYKTKKRCKEIYEEICNAICSKTHPYYFPDD